MVGRLGRRTDRVDEAEGGGEVVQLDRGAQLVALAGPGDVLFGQRLVDVVVGEQGLPHGWVMSSGRTASSNCSAVSSPSSSAASRSVVRSLCAFFATLAALS